RNSGIVKESSVRDGSSNTAMISERLIGPDLGSATPVFANGGEAAHRVMFPLTPAMPIDTGNATAATTYAQSCQNLPATTQDLATRGWSGAVWDGSHASTLEFNSYNHVVPPNGNSCDPSSYSPGQILSVITASSNHPGGVNVVFCDGSV